MTRHRPRSRLLAFAIVLPVLAMLLAATAVAAPKKPYATDISPDSVLAGGCVTYTVMIQNQTNTQQLGSANYTLDSDFGLGIDPSCTVDLTWSIGTASLNGHVIELRNLALATGASVTFTFRAVTSCPPGTSPYVNAVNAKQANNYSGDAGNDMSRTGTPFDLNVDVAGTCSDTPQTPVGSSGTGGASYDVVSNGTGTGRLVLAVGYETVTCEGYPGHTDTVTVDLLFNTTDTKTLTLVFNNTNNEPKNTFRFCLGPAGGGEGTLLPNCSDTTPVDDPPCVISVDQTKKVITMKVLLDAGDPPGKG